ncbi:hypothetical protein [Pasteurella multocida]|uniref:hypothetical protein n=1 Tax=Pasteurella multocida TaxID=747 RepID=UPI001E2900D1|nr:hypothetical protein [Pasteurella multocida]MDY0577450.1 hypothetical protein [Pasteurella multocida]MEB3457024.1 hypothetical protein [Pasteurella multocida]MEB3490067.1 hypothetical protein [Pasteurella multocida]MEB3497997.1 hypothetical protein [Pasteurella multocida]MEB3501212.1 hypothetical protein [Pasteurella multocida]
MNILILNGHQPYSFAEGKLNSTFVERATALLTAKGHWLKFLRCWRMSIACRCCGGLNRPSSIFVGRNLLLMRLQLMVGMQAITIKSGLA